MTKNLALLTDGYKFSQWRQYPPETTYLSSYIESRGGQYKTTTFFGLQMFLKKYFSKKVTMKDVEKARKFCAKYFGRDDIFNYEGWKSVVEKHDGKLPLKIEAVKEGTILPTKNVLVQVVNTDPDFFWLVSYIETILLQAVWYPTTVATRSKHIKDIIKSFYDKTADVPETGAFVDFNLHDFGFRGVSSIESAGIGGAAHLVNFLGTDTTVGILEVEEWYGGENVGFSVPASEHSTITSWGKNGELNAYKNMLDQFMQEGAIVSCVSDSYDIFNAVDNLWGVKLKDRIMRSGGTLVVRPDSGKPEDIVLECVTRLGKAFGFSTNSKHFKVLLPCVSVIQGDGINEDSILTILEVLEANGWSAENVKFGMGGELLQTPNRDTLKFAMKASAINQYGEWQDVYKSPITDIGKVSKKGRLALVKQDGEFKTIRLEQLGDQKNLLDTVWENGVLLRDQKFSEIVELAK